MVHQVVDLAPTNAMQNFPPVSNANTLLALRLIHFSLGLIDEGETPEEAAVRELEEETGYKADRVIESSPIVVSDPGTQFHAHRGIV